jgi:hypothetical protein
MGLALASRGEWPPPGNGAMQTGLPVLESTDWSRLYHAYGRAIDTPRHLRALFSEDAGAREQALSHLWSAVMHQGTPSTATGPAALVVAGLLSDDRIDQDKSIRPNLLAFLAAVAEAPQQAACSLRELEQRAQFDLGPFLDAQEDDALYGNEDAANALFARAVLGCIEAAPVLMESMLDGMTHGSPSVRACAAMGAVTLASSEALRGQADDLKWRLLTLARVAEDPDERAAHVLALGELGFAPVAFLEDESPSVRLCAALAPGLADHPAALDELLTALEQHAGEIDNWFTERPPQFSSRPRFRVVARLVQRVTDFERLADAAVAVVGVTAKYCVDYDWGPLLAAAFPDGTGQVKTAAQRRFLGALTRNKELWDSSLGNAYRWFERAGLPYDRRECAKRIK